MDKALTILEVLNFRNNPAEVGVLWNGFGEQHNTRNDSAGVVT